MTDKLRDAAQQALTWFECFHKGSSIDSPASSIQCSNALRAALAQQDAQAVPVAWMSKMDFEALKSRGRVTTTLYGEPVGNKTNEVGLCLATPTPPRRRNNHD